MVNTLGMKFVWIEPGTFMMGSSEDEPGRFDWESPQHQVTLTKGFYMQSTEVTQKQWRGVMGNHPSNFKDCDDCPVEKVSWNDVQEFIKKLNKTVHVLYVRLHHVVMPLNSTDIFKTNMKSCCKMSRPVGEYHFQ